MPITLPLQKMSIEEKIQLMEVLWSDLCGASASALTPDWHGKLLANREAIVRAGEDEITDWELAKNRISDDLQ